MDTQGVHDLGPAALALLSTSLCSLNTDVRTRTCPLLISSDDCPAISDGLLPYYLWAFFVSPCQAEHHIPNLTHTSPLPRRVSPVCGFRPSDSRQACHFAG